MKLLVFLAIVSSVVIVVSVVHGIKIGVPPLLMLLIILAGLVIGFAVEKVVK